VSQFQKTEPKGFPGDKKEKKKERLKLVDENGLSKGFYFRKKLL